jgi:hypothetical protein
MLPTGRVALVLEHHELPKESIEGGLPDIADGT